MTDFIRRAEGGLGFARQQTGGLPIGLTVEANAARLRAGKKVRSSLFYDKEFQSKVITMAADGLIQNVWKPMVLLRPAWTLRVVGEEQVRMAAADLHAFNHPMRAFIAAVTDKNLKLGLTTRGQLYKSDLYGDALSIATDYQAAMSRGSGGWLNSPGGYGSQNWIKIELGSADYDKWWFREINQLQSDRASSEIARMMTEADGTRNIDDIVDSFMEGELAGVRDKLMADGSSMRHKQLSSREGAEAYIQSLEARIHLKTGGHYEVLKDDGWWYDDAGMRLRRETSSKGIQSNLPAGPRGVRIKTRSLDEFHDARVRGGSSPDEVSLELKRMYDKGITDDRTFNMLDPDGRTVLIPEGNVSEVDIIADSRVLEFRVTEKGNQSLIEAIGSGKLGKADFHGEVSGAIEKATMKELKSLRESGAVKAPAFVKGVDESDVGRLDNVMNKTFDMFMGKQTNRYSRSPVFMREYWNTMADLADQGLLDPATFRKLESLMGNNWGGTVTTQNASKALRHTDEMAKI